MVWIYKTPLDSHEQKLYLVLKRKLKEKDIATLTVKLISLYGFLKSLKFSSPKEIRESVFLDKEKTHPVFTEEQSKSIFKALKKKGGASKYPFTDHVAKKGLDIATTFVPEEIKGTIQSVYDLATSPVRIVKNDIPFGDLIIGAMHGATEVGVTTAGDVAEGAGGAVGAAFIAPFTALAAGMASLVSVGEEDFGQAIAHLTNAVPVIGSAFGKGLTQMEHQVENLKNHPDVAEYVPIVGEYITGRSTRSFSDIASNLSPELLTSPETRQKLLSAIPKQYSQVTDMATKSPDELRQQFKSRVSSEVAKRLPPVPAVAGKRFSTRKNRYNKWPKTRRNGSRKV